MKKTIYIIIVIIFSALCLNAQETGTFTDARDGKVYETAKIGNTVWMTQNFAYKPNQGNYWAYVNDEFFAINAKLGYLYDWNTASKIAPKGWRLPTVKEANDLLEHFGGKMEKAQSKLVGRRSVFNLYMAGYTVYRKASPARVATEKKRARAAKKAKQIFRQKGKETAFWLKDEFDKKEGFSMEFSQSDKEVYVWPMRKVIGYSVRLVKK